MGQELLKRRIRLSFDFDITCNDGPIVNSCDETKEYDIALLKSFLTTERLIDMLVSCAEIELGVDCPEIFMEAFYATTDTYVHYLFGQAINQLEGEQREYWQGIRDSEDVPWGGVLSLATEKLYECFTAEFIKSTFQIVEE